MVFGLYVCRNLFCDKSDPVLTRDKSIAFRGASGQLAKKKALEELRVNAKNPGPELWIPFSKDNPERDECRKPQSAIFRGLQRPASASC